MFHVLLEGANGLADRAKGRSHAILLVAVWVAASAGSATAISVLDFGPVDIVVPSIFSNGGNSNENFGGDVVEANDPTVFSTLVQPDLFFRFPTSPSALPAGFVSAASRERERAVSARVESFYAIRRWAAPVPSIRSDHEPERRPVVAPEITYVIPRLEATIFPGSASGISSVQANAAARLIATVLDGTGAELSRNRIFSYELGQALASFIGEDGIFRSTDLQDEQGDGFLISAAGVRGVEYGPFEGTRFLPSIPIGGALILEYQFEAAGSTISREHGFQAFVGDPFDISAGGGFEITLADPPECLKPQPSC